MQDDRLEELLARLFDGALSPEEEKELGETLAGSAAARSRAASYMRLEGTVAYLGQAGCLPSERPARLRRPRRRFAPGTPGVLPWMAGAAAAACFFLFLAFGLSTSRPAPPRREAVREPEKTRQEQEARLETLDREIRTLAVPTPDPAREALLARKEEERRQVEAELELARAVEQESRPLPPPDPPPAPPAIPRTAPAVARVTDAEGESSVRPGEELPEGREVTVGTAGRAALLFSDGTRLELSGGAALRDLSEGAFIARGTVRADVRRQPAGRSFVLRTPHGEARVLGTRFSLVVTPDLTRLEVQEGRVRLTRASDRRGVDVSAGHFAVAAVGVELAARPLPIDEIFLTAAQARISGGEWRLLKDPAAVGGLLLEAQETANAAVGGLPIDPPKINDWYARGRSRSWVSFVFDADANKDYRVWVRGRCIAPPGKDRLLSDSVMMEVAHGRFVHRPADWHVYSDYLCAFNGYGNEADFGWCGGNLDRNRSQTPITLRFSRRGRQIVRIHAAETPVQIDAIWLSATQTSRPAPDVRPGRK